MITDIPHPNNVNPYAQPGPPPTNVISIHDIIQIRVALETISDPGPDMRASIENLDRTILLFTNSLGK